jgi:cytochrome oxidase assembly protein ShyY1
MDGEDYGLVRDLDHMDVEREMIPAEKHMSYAFQWFSLAAALVIIYLVVNVKRPGSSKEEKQ